MIPLINLLPWRALQRRRRLRWRLSIMLSVIVLFLIGFGWGWRQLSQEIIVLQNQCDALKSQQNRLQNQQREQQQDAPQAQGQVTEKNRRYQVSRWGEVLTSLARKMPEYSWLRSINWQGGMLTIEGHALEMGDLDKIEVLLRQLPGPFRVTAGPVSYQVATGLTYTFILEENGG